MFLFIIVVGLVVAAIAGTVTLVANDGYSARPARMWTSNLDVPAPREASIVRFA